MESNTSISFLESCQPFGPGEKFCGSHQSWSHRRRRRRKWMSLQLLLSNCCAVPFQCFYLFLLVRIAVDAAKSGAGQLSDGGGEKVPQRFAMEPQDQTAVVGSRVSLPCRVMNKSGQLQVSLYSNFKSATNKLNMSPNLHIFRVNSIII